MWWSGEKPTQNHLRIICQKVIVSHVLPVSFVCTIYLFYLFLTTKDYFLIYYSFVNLMACGLLWLILNFGRKMFLSTLMSFLSLYKFWFYRDSSGVWVSVMTVRVFGFRTSNQGGTCPSVRTLGSHSEE